LTRFREALVVVLAILTPSTVRAEPLVIDGGIRSFLRFDEEGDFFNFVGNGFEVGNQLGDSFDKVLAPSCTFKCEEGDAVNPSWRTAGEVSLGSGTARFGTSTFTDVTYRGTLVFDVTPTTFPATTDNVIGFDLPFSFTGSLRGFEGDDQVFAVDLVGQGRALQSFLKDEDGTFFLDSNSSEQFNFTGGQPAPVPEPASVLLLGGGLGSAMVARLRKRRGRA